MNRLTVLLLFFVSLNCSAGLIATSGIKLNDEIPEYGGLIVKFTGLSGNEASYYIDGSYLYSGVLNPYREDEFWEDVGIWNGWSSELADLLGSGFSQVSYRFSMWDGDNSTGDADENANFLYVNDIYTGNFSDVDTYEHSRDGSESYGDVNGAGFSENYNSTGWFSVDSVSYLEELYSSLGVDGSLIFTFYSESGKKNFISFGELGVDYFDEAQSNATNSVDASTTGLFSLFAIFIVLRHRNKYKLSQFHSF